jgi:hypothetical protein
LLSTHSSKRPHGRTVALHRFNTHEPNEREKRKTFSVLSLSLPHLSYSFLFLAVLCFFQALFPPPIFFVLDHLLAFGVEATFFPPGSSISHASQFHSCGGKQVTYFGMFDGHSGDENGTEASTYAAENCHYEVAHGE